LNYDKAVKMRPKTPKSDKTGDKQTHKIKASLSQFIVDIPFRFSRYRNGVKGEKQKLFEIFHKNSLQKENCVVLCRRKGIPTAISRAY